MTFNIERTKKALTAIVGEAAIKEGELLSKHTSFKIGGPADLFVSPASIDQLIKVIKYVKDNDLPYFILGNGSNLLAYDTGYRGVIIKVYKNLSHVHIEDNTVTAEAGVSLARLAGIIAEASLEGFEFASGIPGTLGGAVFMNAGAYGGEMKDVLIFADVLDESGNMITLSNQELDLGYRTSIIQKKGWTVVRATMAFVKGDQKVIKDKMKELNKRRQDKQPLELPSAGSAFKRPQGYYAGKLIMDAGLRGYQIGGAAVSDKHCGFIVNLGNATSEDVLSLVDFIRNEVEKQFSVTLEPELRVIK